MAPVGIIISDILILASLVEMFFIYVWRDGTVAHYIGHQAPRGERWSECYGVFLVG